MKKRLLTLIPTLLPSITSARTDLGLKDIDTKSIGGVSTLVSNVQSILGNIILAIGVLMIIYGGIVLISSAGNPDKATQGKKIITYAVIGFVVFLLAKVIIRIFAKVLGADFS